MNKLMNRQPLIDAINANETFLLSSHQSLDGDCIGSQLAMAWYLKSIGKSVTIYCTDPLPMPFKFLKDAELITQTKPTGRFDALMVIDCSSLPRIGWDVPEGFAKTIINIDHHRDNKMFGAINIVDPTAAAAGVVIFEFFKDCGIDIPLHTAQYLYAAIMTDTGGFRFSNTSGRVLKVCGELADAGIDCADMYEKIYECHTPQGLMLRSRIWSSLKYHLDGKVCSMDMPMSLIEELGAQYSDAEGMADNTVTALGVEVGIMTKHTPQETHISLRSKGNIDVGKIAQKVAGGGGHNCAAGCTIKLPYDEAMTQMLGMLDTEINNP